MAILQCLESRTQIKTRPAGKGHSKIGVPVRIDRQLRDLDFLLSKHSLNGSADLPFIEHYGLRIEDAPAIPHMRIDPNGRRLATRIESCLPDALTSLQTHHVGGGQIRTTPGCRDRMTMHVAQDCGTSFGQSSFVT